MSTELWLLLIFSIFTGIIAAKFAESKGRPVVAWFFIGLLLNLLGVLLAVAVAPVESSGVTQQCPECAEIVKGGGREVPLLWCAAY